MIRRPRIFSSKYKMRTPEVPVHEAVLIGAPEFKKALIDGITGETFTYHEVQQMMEAVGSGFSRQGIKKGDIVAFYAPNSIKYAIGMLSCFSIGAVFTGINTNFKVHELGFHLNDCKPKAIVTVDTNLLTLKKALDGKEFDTSSVKVVITLQNANRYNYVYFGSLLEDDGSAFPRNIQFNVKEDLAAIIYTSGSTGVPKGCMLTHSNMVASITSIRSVIVANEKMVPLIFLPMFHIFGVLLMLITLSHKGTGVILSEFKCECFLSAIERFKPNHLCVVPPMVNFLAKHPMVEQYNMSSIKIVLSAAAPLTGDIQRTFHDRFPGVKVCQAYGLTESCGAVILETLGKFKTGSAGNVIPNIEVKILDTQSRLPLGIAEDGEIWIKGAVIMKGYINRPDLTAERIESGWCRTGDVGHFDDDEYLFLSGRLKDIIEYREFKVSPDELESILLTHPDVQDVVVIGLPHEYFGAVPRAFIVLKEGSVVLEDMIYEFIQERVSHSKWLSGGVQFIESIPKTATGQVLRRDILNMASKQS